MEEEIKIVPYNSEWSEQFKTESTKLKQALPSLCLDVFHIGSTSVENLSAKPIVDLMMVISSIQESTLISQTLIQLGYDYLGENGMLFRLFFKKKGFNLHVFEEGDSEIQRHLLFRNWMRNHPEDQLKYAALKQKLAQKAGSNRQLYYEGKESFIKEIQHQAGYRGEHIVFPLTQRECEAFERLKKEFLDSFYLREETLTSDQTHLVLYSDSEVIGAASIESLEGKSHLTFLILDKKSQRKGLGSAFLSQIEKWLTFHSLHQLSIQAPVHLKDFFLKKGYQLLYATDASLSFEKKLFKNRL